MFRNNHLQLMIGSKSHEGKITLFSTDSKSKTVKQPWGSISEMLYPVNQKEGDGDPLFGLKNKQGSIQAFRRSWLDPGLWKVHPFTTKWMSMRAEGREATLAKFVTVLVRTKFFVDAPCEGLVNICFSLLERLSSFTEVLGEGHLGRKRYE